jgi:hypothetical protein
MRNALLLSFSIVFIAILSSCKQDNEKVRILEARLVVQSDSISLYQKRIDTLQKLAEKWQDMAPYELDESELDAYIKAGFKNPATEIIADLDSKPALIPYKAVLGGTMRYGKIILLSPKHALAYVDDGHIGGYVVYTFRLEKNKQIKWTVLDKYSEDAD